MRRCLETRITPEGFKRRRYQSPTGVRSTTIEVPIELWQAVNGRGASYIRYAQAMFHEERQSLKRQGLALVASGLSQREVARRLGVQASTVNRWIKGRMT